MLPVHRSQVLAKSFAFSSSLSELNWIEFYPVNSQKSIRPLPRSNIDTRLPWRYWTSWTFRYVSLSSASFRLIMKVSLRVCKQAFVPSWVKLTTVWSQKFGKLSAFSWLTLNRAWLVQSMNLPPIMRFSCISFCALLCFELMRSWRVKRWIWAYWRL